MLLKRLSKQLFSYMSDYIDNSEVKQEWRKTMNLYWRGVADLNTVQSKLDLKYFPTMD